MSIQADSMEELIQKITAVDWDSVKPERTMGSIYQNDRCFFCDFIVKRRIFLIVKMGFLAYNNM